MMKINSKRKFNQFQSRLDTYISKADRINKKISSSTAISHKQKINDNRVCFENQRYSGK